MKKNDLKSYKKNTVKSAELFKKSKKFHINGVHHNIRFFEPYPFVTKSSNGKFLIDVDSNKYVDFWMGHWSLILGHSPKNVKSSTKMQLDNGWMHGTVSKNSIDLSEKISKAIPVAEKIRYASTGTEATMYAVRLARTATKRKTVAKIDGGWHGYTTDLLKTINWPFRKSESGGLVDEKYVESLPYNDLENSIKILKSKKKDLAAAKEKAAKELTAAKELAAANERAAAEELAKVKEKAERDKYHAGVLLAATKQEAAEELASVRAEEALKLAAAKALAGLAKEPVTQEVLDAYGLDSLEFGKEYIIPKAVDSRLLGAVSTAVAQAAIDTGVARQPLPANYPLKSISDI